jgi:hypothetical protein
MQGSRKCAVPRDGKPDSGKAPNGPRKRWGAHPARPPIACRRDRRRHLPPGRAGRTRHLAPYDPGVTVVDRPTISGQFSGRFHAHFRGAFRTRSRCCARAASGSEGCYGRSGISRLPKTPII